MVGNDKFYISDIQGFKMQDNISHLLDLNKRKTCSEHYNMSPPPDSGMWNPLCDKVRNRLHSKHIKMQEISEKP